MGLANAINRIVVPKNDLNELKAGTSTAHYEVHYLTLNHRASGAGFWIRYTLDRRGPNATGSEAALWFHCFRRGSDAPVIGLKQSFDTARLTTGAGIIVRIGGSELAEGHAVGSVEKAGLKVGWDLRFQPSPNAVWLVPAPMRALGLAKTSVLFANIDVRMNGTITVGEEEFSLQGEPGCQTHLWGSKRAHGWTWGHCNAFDGDVPCAVDGVAAMLRKGNRIIGPLTGMFVRYRGEDYLCNSLWDLVRAKSESRFPSWSFRCGARGTQFHGTFTCRPEQLAQVAYEDADGEAAYCCNTEVGDLSLEVRRGGVNVETLRSTGRAHFEFVSRDKQPGVRFTVCE